MDEYAFMFSDVGIDWKQADECSTAQRTSKPKLSAVTSLLKKEQRLINSKQNTEKKASHTFMDQGRLAGTYAGKMRVELKDMSAFRAAIIEDIKVDRMHPLVERFPSVYYFAVDFDFKTKHKLSNADKQKYSQTAQAATKEFIGSGSNEHKSIVCVVNGDDRMCKDAGATLFKDGVHQHWPRLCVNHKQAKHLLTYVILPAMQQHHANEGIDWTKTLDTHIYNEGSLRPIYTLKREMCSDCIKIQNTYSDRRKLCSNHCKFAKPCDHCKPETRVNKACVKCKGEVVMPGTNHHYVPLVVLDENGAADDALTAELKQDPQLALEFTSVIPTTEQDLSFEFACADEQKDNKRKATTPALLAAAKKQATEKSKQKLTFEDVLVIYREAGGNLSLQEIPGPTEGTMSWRELSPGHDSRRCLCPACDGAMHSDNALLTDTDKGLLYTCLSTRNKHFLTVVETELDLCCGGDRGLAKLVALIKQGDIYNVSGDNTETVVCLSIEITACCVAAVDLC
jgi:hypothetical protein